MHKFSFTVYCLLINCCAYFIRMWPISFLRYHFVSDPFHCLTCCCLITYVNNCIPSSYLGTTLVHRALSHVTCYLFLHNLLGGSHSPFHRWGNQGSEVQVNRQRFKPRTPHTITVHTTGIPGALHNGCLSCSFIFLKVHNPYSVGLGRGTTSVLWICTRYASPRCCPTSEEGATQRC